jgi:hypothetical protein
MDKSAIESIIHGEIMEIQNYFEEWDTPDRYKPETYEENRMYDAGYLEALKWVLSLTSIHVQDNY